MKTAVTTTLYTGHDVQAALETVHKDAKGRATVWLFRRRAAGVRHSSTTATLMKVVATVGLREGVQLQRVIGAINRLFANAENLNAPEFDSVRYDWLYEEYGKTLTITVTEVVNAPTESKAIHEA